jgi:hypothetical protein
MNYIKKYINFNNYEEEKEFIIDPLLRNCPDKFIKFLKKENVYDKFVKNLNITGWKNNVWLDQYHYCNGKILDEYISKSFRWSSTIEGHKFWYLVEEKWHNIIYL